LPNALQFIETKPTLGYIAVLKLLTAVIVLYLQLLAKYPNYHSAKLS
jgi:hypothetical protein